MPPDSALYGVRKPKNTPKEISSSTDLAFTSTLSSLLSVSTSRTTTGRQRPSKSKPDIFSSHNTNTNKRAARDLQDEHEDDADKRQKLGRQDIGGVDDAVLHRSKRKMEAKAKIYARMKRGELGDNENALVDFDRKWAESGGKDSESEIESDDGQGDMVEYEDEYGRARRGTRAEAERMERRKQNKIVGAEELGRMSARPAMPQKVIFGDTVQTLAFNPDEEIAVKMEELAEKRDRSATPPEMKHYDASAEIRSKGVGFYAFSKDEALREEEMKALERERLETERARKEREEKKAKRLKDIADRRRMVEEKRAKKLADNFLDGLTDELGSLEKAEKPV